MRNEFIKHAALAFFGSAWADAAEESGNSEVISGCEILDVMPNEIDPAAISAAKYLVMDIEKANSKTIEEILAFIDDNADGDRPATAEYFGHYAAMQAMGHGVGLGDAFGSFVYDTIKVPYVEFGSHSLERDYF